MSINKSLTSLENRNSPDFEKGLNDFVERSEAHVYSNGLIRCPCRACVNNSLKTILQMKGHIHRFGFERRYVTWVYHGESRTWKCGTFESRYGCNKGVTRLLNLMQNTHSHMLIESLFANS